MADFFKGLAGGFGTGLQLGQALRQRRQEDELAKAYAKPEEFTDYTPEQMQEIQRLQSSGAYDVQAMPGAEGAVPTLRFAPRQGIELGQGEMLATPTEIAPQRVQRYGGQTVAGQFDPMALQGLQMREAARVMGAYGDPARAAQLQAEATRMEREAKEAPLRQRALETQVGVGEAQLRGLGRAEEKEVGFNTAFDQINKTEYKTPAERDAAVLNAVKQFKGPEVAAQLEANYSTNERNKILNEGAKFDQTIKQARLKGPAAALKAIDELNDSFTLEVDGFKVTQVNKDGTRVPFLQAKDANEFALMVDSRIKDGGAFELAKFRQDELTKNAQIAYYNAMANKAAREGASAANQLSNVQLGFTRDANGQPVQVMSGIRFNKKTGDAETVQIKLDQSIVPAAALDPKKIADEAEKLVGTPIDPTNKKGPQHTFQTAKQAVLDQTFNQYLGTGGPVGGLDLSPAAIAKRILEGQKEAPSKPVGLAAGRNVDPLDIRYQNETDAIALGKQARYSPEVQALVDARNLAAAQRESAYLQQERQRMLQRPQ